MTDRTPLDLDSLTPFTAKTRADWMYILKKSLSGEQIEALSIKTEDGISRGPLTTLNDRLVVPTATMRSGEALLGGRAWHICAPVRDSELAFANTQLLADLEGGASAARITLKTAGGQTKGKTGLSIGRAADFERLLDRVHIDLIPISFKGASTAHIDMLMSLPKLRAAHITFDSDVIPKDCPEGWRMVGIDAAAVHNSGGTDAQELAVMAANAAHAMKTYGPELAARHISIELAADCDAHITIAKIRAARRIYARIASSFDLKDASVPLYAVSSTRMMQSVDPWTNMLRLMSAGFGAVVGGADYVTLLPFTEALSEQSLGGATPFGYRASRNMQLMMMEESRLGHVEDAAHGSYFHERMSEELALAAWSKFQDIERNGGIKAYEGSPEYAADISAAIENRKAAEAPIVGVTLHKAEAIREPKLRGEKS